VPFTLEGAGTPVTTLEVRELKGLAQCFTPNLGLAMGGNAIAYRAPGQYEATFQLLGRRLSNDPRLNCLATLINFTPAFSWASQEVVLLPLRTTHHGQRVTGCLRKLHRQFPSFRCSVTWSEPTKRHVVRAYALNEQERELIAGVAWPGPDQILEALSESLFDDIDKLAAVNEDVRQLLTAREVEP
jgi:hypothetical protein